jgi:DNA-binding CsgD family transcriptional regulator/tetratricopeptide (TPR) repeat protein
MAGPEAFVGRESELSRLLEALGGDARMVLVVGDAGVGKTRFTEEVMGRAASAGMVVARGECLPLAGTLPLLPVATALGELGRLAEGMLLTTALAAAPDYVRTEVSRLGPGGGTGPGGRDVGWQRERLFSAVAELLDAVARESPVGLVIEDVHWADSATLDCLTFLGRAGRRDAVTVVVTCRSDEAPLAEHVATWLAQLHGTARVEEISLGPLSRAEVAGQVSDLAGGPVTPRVVDELYARAEGNPFFTEQLVAAALGGADGELGISSRLPTRLAELLTARAGRCGGEAREVLAALSVAGRPLAEDSLGTITGLGVGAVRRGLRELASARLLANDGPGSTHRPRHALLAEAVADALLPGERSGLHERTARALEAASGQSLAAEAAGHWEAADRPVEELAARLAAAKAAEHVFGYAEAAAHWQRAIDLCQAPGAAVPSSTEVPRLYVRAIDALNLSGDGVRAGAAAEEALRLFADQPDPAEAAIVYHRAAYFRAIETPAAGLPLIRKSLQLFGQSSPSAEQAEAWLDYGTAFLFHAEGQLAASATAVNHALEIAEVAGATAQIPHLLPWLSNLAFLRGQVEEGFAIIQRGRASAETTGNSAALVWLAVTESNALLKMGKFQKASDVALRGLATAPQSGLHGGYLAAILASNASEALLACGRTADAAALIGPLTTGPPDRDHWFAHEARAEIELLNGDIAAAARRWQQIKECAGQIGSIDTAREGARRTAELALWAGRPSDALEQIQEALALFTAPDLTIMCGQLLAAGMRACADLADEARARRDDPAVSAARAAAAGLSTWTDRVGNRPFTDHPFVGTIPADRADWDAEWTRLAGGSDPTAWETAGKAWQALGCPHRAAYAWWRQAEAQLETRLPTAAAAAALRAAGAAAKGHAPLLAQLKALAERARISLSQPPSPAPGPDQASEPVPYGLTARELAVLRLLASGRTNAQIGAELYISPKTAGVHVSNILRKLQVSGRVQAAALAERAGMLHPRRP